MEPEYHTIGEHQMFQTIRDELNCPICKEFFTSPKTLSCGHIFCSSCLQEAVKANHYTDTLGCPTCRRPTPLSVNGVDALPNNYHLSNLIEKVLQQKKALPASPLQYTGTNKVAERCKQHDKLTKLFCEACDTSICMDECLTELHSGHRVVNLSVKVKELTESLKAVVPEIHRAVEKAMQVAEEVKKEQQTLCDQKSKVLKDINAYFCVVHNAITKRENAMCEAVGKYYHSKIEQLDEALITIDVHRNTLSQNVSSVAQVSSDVPPSYIQLLATTVQEQNTAMSQSVEKAMNLRFSNEFLSFTGDKTIESQLTEAGSLSECVSVENSSAVKVKAKVLVRQGTETLQLQSTSPDLDEEEGTVYENPSDNDDYNVDGNGEQVDGNNPADTPFYYDNVGIRLRNGPPVMTRPKLPPPRPPSALLQENDEYDEVIRRQSISSRPRQTFYENYPSDIHSQILMPCKKFILNNKLGNLENPIQPRGLAVSLNNNDIYITDTGNHCVLVITCDGLLSRVIGSKGSGKGQFLMPIDVVLDEKCNVYVADRQNGSVQKFIPNGKYKLRFKQGESPNDLKEPNGLAVFKNRVYVSDRLGGKIFVYDQQGSVLSYIVSHQTPVGENPFQPSGITVHPKYEKIFVADRCNHQVLVFNNDGDLVHGIGDKGHGRGQLLFPNGVAITPNDLLLVTETENNRVSVFNSRTGEFIKSFGKAGEAEGMFIIPRHIATNKHSEVYVADEKNQRIQVFKVDEDPAYIEIQEGVYIK